MEFYALWCGHCQQLKPVYEEVAKAFDDVGHIMIAKLNADKHEIPGVEIDGFPTIKLFKKGKKKDPIEYEGMGRSAEIIKFLRSRVHPIPRQRRKRRIVTLPANLVAVALARRKNWRRRQVWRNADDFAWREHCRCDL